MKPPKHDPYGENPGLFEGYAWCDECQGDGGGEYCKGFSHERQEPDYEWVECSVCDGTGQVMTFERALEEDRKKLEAQGADAGIVWTGEWDEEIPF